MIKILDCGFDIKECYNCDTNTKHNLLIYNYAVNNIQGYNIIIGEVKNKQDINTLIQFCNSIIMSKISLLHPTFICSYIKKLEKYDGKTCINYSKDGYELLFSKKFMTPIIDEKTNELILPPSNQIFYNSLKSIIVDNTSKRFVASEENCFHPIEYYENKELEAETNTNDNSKKYVKTINS